MLLGLALLASLRHLLDAFQGCFTVASFAVFTATVIGMIPVDRAEDDLRDDHLVITRLLVPDAPVVLAVDGSAPDPTWLAFSRRTWISVSSIRIGH